MYTYSVEIGNHSACARWIRRYRYSSFRSFARGTACRASRFLLIYQTTVRKGLSAADMQAMPSHSRLKQHALDHSTPFCETLTYVVRARRHVSRTEVVHCTFHSTNEDSGTSKRRKTTMKTPLSSEARVTILAIREIASKALAEHHVTTNASIPTVVSPARLVTT